MKTGDCLADRLDVIRVLGRADDMVFVLGDDRVTGERRIATWGRPPRRARPPFALEPEAEVRVGEHVLCVFTGIEAVLAGRPAPWPEHVGDEVLGLLETASRALPPGLALGHAAWRHVARHQRYGWVLLTPPIVTPLTADHRRLWRFEVDQRIDDDRSWAAHSDAGPVRMIDEDCWATVRVGSGRLAVCADGAGGMMAGELGIRLALARVLPGIAGPDPAVEVLRRCDAVMRELVAQHEAFRGVGAAAVALYREGSRARIAWVGDCRAWRWRDSEPEPLTTDHTLVNELVRSGKIRPDEVDGHPMQNILLRCLGVSDAVEIEARTVDAGTRDRWLLTTDGVHQRGLPLEGLSPGAGLIERVRHLVARATTDNGAAVVLGRTST